MPSLHIVITDTGFPDADVEKGVLAALDAKVTVAHCRTEDEVIAAARDADAGPRAGRISSRAAWRRP